MERTEWLRQMREMAEAFYDRYAPLVTGSTIDETHREFLQKFLERVPPGSNLLSAGCGAGKNDGVLVEAGHSVLGIDQSEGMLRRAREHVPAVRYSKIGFQEMDFQEAFEGAICVDALEHVSPEDWPEILRRFREALKPGGFLYFTVDKGGDHVEEAYERAEAMGLPVVPGEVADGVAEGFERLMAMETLDDDSLDSAVYHYHPPLRQVRSWLDQVGLAIEEEGADEPNEGWYGYAHFLVRKK